MRFESTLTAAQQNVLNHLASGKSVAQTAEICGVHRNTIANWRRDVPAFTAQLDQAVSERTALFQELIPDAIAVLRTILHNEQASPSVRLRAALTVIKMGTPTQPRKPAQIRTSAPDPEPELKAEPELASFVQTADAALKPANPAQFCTTKSQPIRVAPQPGRNSACPCNSGLKFKRCCINKVA